MDTASQRAALLEHAAHVIVGSSSKFKVEDALKRLKVDVAKASVEGKITGDVIDAKDSASVKAFFEKIGEIDHLVWTSGDVINFAGQGLEEQKGELLQYVTDSLYINARKQDFLMCAFGERPSRPRRHRSVKRAH